MQSVLIRNGTLITPRERLVGTVGIRNGRLVHVGAGVPSGPWDQEIDARGLYVLPGFLDLQVNGFGGHDFMSGDPADVISVANLLPHFGVTGFLATAGTSPRGVMTRSLKALAQGSERIEANPLASGLLGIHVEGPYISHLHKGAHDSGQIRPFDPEEWAEWVDAAGETRMLTLAPEVPRNLAAIPDLLASGVIISMGHSDASYDEALEAAAAGVRCATHAYNGMRGLHHRDPGVLGAILSQADICCGVIADGVHVHPAALRILFRAKGPESIFLVTDAISVAGLPPGTYDWWGRKVVFDGVAPRLQSGVSLAGAGPAWMGLPTVAEGLSGVLGYSRGFESIPPISKIYDSRRRCATCVKSEFCRS